MTNSEYNQKNERMEEILIMINDQIELPIRVADELDHLSDEIADYEEKTTH
jgi:hypothetical protein